MQERLFRKTALNRLASPDQLDRLMQITDLQGWLALFGLGILALLAVIWGVFGTIPITAQGEGSIKATGQTLEVVAYIPLENAQEIRSNMDMKVRVEPLTIDAEQYGYLVGEVTEISSAVALPEQIQAMLGRSLEEGVLWVEVRIGLQPDDTPSGYKWTISQGPTDVDLKSGTPVRVIITIRTERPISRVFGGL